MKPPRKSRSTAVHMLKRIFKDSPQNFITLEAIFRAWGRNMNEEAKNKSWFSNKLPHLKYYDLVKPVYSYEQKPRKLEGIELTLEGRRELRRGGSGIVQSTLFSPLANDQEVISSKNEIDVKDVLEVIRKLKETNPDFEVTFNLDVKLKQV